MNKDMNKVWRTIFLITQIGITMLTTIFLCMGIGYLVDKYFGTKLLTWFIVAGVLAGFRSVYILINKFISYNMDSDESGNNTDKITPEDKNTLNIDEFSDENPEDCEKDDLRGI